MTTQIEEEEEEEEEKTLSIFISGIPHTILISYGFVTISNLLFYFDKQTSWKYILQIRHSIFQLIAH